MFVECAILLSEKVAMLKIASHRIYLSPKFKASYHSPSFMRRFLHVTILEIVLHVGDIGCIPFIIACQYF